MAIESIRGVQVSHEPLLTGWGKMGELKHWSDKAGLFDYHGWQLWIAKANLRVWKGAYYAKTFAIRSAKEYATEKST